MLKRGVMWCKHDRNTTFSQYQETFNSIWSCINIGFLSCFEIPFPRAPIAKRWKYSQFIQGVPKKTLVSVQRLLEVLKNDLQIKVGWVLKNSGNFQSNEHRNFVFLPKNAWDIKAQSWLPSSQNNAFEQLFKS